MIDTKLRGAMQPYFNNIGYVFLKCGLKPNVITLIGFVIGILSGLFTSFDMRFLAFIALWISGLLDVIDGTVARLSNNSSQKGAFMDLIFDRMVEATFILGFTFLMPEGYLSYILFLISVIFNFSTFMVAGSLFKNAGAKSMHYDIGLIERTETFIVFSMMLFIKDYSFYILTVFSILIIFTGIIRFIRIMKYVTE